MECNREERNATSGAELSEGALFCEARMNLPEAWAVQFLPFQTPGPIAEAFSHRAFPRDSARALPEIFSSLQLSKCPIFRLVFRGMNHLSRALAESRKCARERGLFARVPGGLISSKTSTGAMSCPSWMIWISLDSRTRSAPKPRKHPAPPLRIASGPGESRFGLS